MISSFLILFSFVLLFSTFHSLEKVWADPVIATIPVGNQPSGIAYDLASKEMYVSNFASNTVSVIDTSNNHVIAYISVGNKPVTIAYNSHNNNTYVTNVGDNTVSVIDTSSPSANAGSNKHVQPFQTVHLNGSASFDPRGSPLTYHWTQVSGPNVFLSGSDSVTPYFEAPDVNVRTPLTFQLVVRNNNGMSSSPSTVRITVDQAVPPIADAGRNQEVQPYQTVQLNGSASSDPSGLTPLTY